MLRNKVADAPFGKLKNMLPSLGQKKDGTEVDDQYAPEDNSRGEKVSKKQHDVLAQLSIRPQTELDARILTPSKIKNVGFHTSEEGGYSFKEVEEFHELVVKTVGWYADKLFERDSDVRTLATEVDKYITDFQNMKFEIELLESTVASQDVDQDAESKIDSLEEKILRLERENSSLKSQNELLKTKLEEAQSVDRKEEPTVTTGGLSNAEREHLQQMEEWAAQVTVLYDQMEQSLAETQEQNSELLEHVEALSAQIQDSTGTEEIQAQLDALAEQLNVKNAEYEALVQQFAEKAAEYDALKEQFDNYVSETEQYNQEMEEYTKGLAEAYEALQEEVAAAQTLPEAQEVAHEAPEPEPAPVPAPAPSLEDRYRLPPGVSEDDL
jgi:hypothetical protein